MNWGAEYLLWGFARARRRLHFVLVDMLAKLVWMVATAIVFWSAGIWFAAAALLEESDVFAFQSGEPLLAGAAFLHVLVINSQTLFGSFIVAGTISVGIWVLIESFVRGGLLSLTGESFIHDAVGHFGRFFSTGFARRAILLMATALIVFIAFGPLLAIPMTQWPGTWIDVRWPAVAGLSMLGLLAFSLMILETLLRSDAVDALGQDLPRVVGVFGMLATIEAAFVVVAATVAVLIFEVVESPAVTAVAGVLLIGLSSAAHSYLLLVRYSAVGIMSKKKGYGTIPHYANDL